MRRAARGWDVVVVGARVAGASTALLLARAGLRVLVLDRARRGSDTLSTHALMRGGVLQLSRWGVLAGVPASGAPPVRRVTFDYGAERVSVAVKPSAGVDALYAPRRTVLDAVLVDAAEAAGATFRFGTSVTEVVRDAGSVVGAVVRDHDGTTWTERAPLLVGADGRGSVVAARVAAPTIVTGAHASAFAYGYWPAGDLDGYHWVYADGVSAGAIPTNDGLACVFVASRPAALSAALGEQPRAAGMHGVLARLQSPLAELTAGPPAGRVRLFPGAPARLRRAYGPGWALVGDAGCWKDPLSTHGITAALRDAELLATAVVGAPAAPGGVLRALAAYQRQRDSVALPMHPLADRLASHDWDVDEVRRLLMGLSASMSEEVEAIQALDAVAARTA